MTQQEIIDNNKLIAEFMDYKVSDDQIKDEYGFWIDLNDTFNVSWDWLMPVVEKIESDVLGGDVIFTIEGDNAWVEYSMEYRLNVYGYTKLKSTYRAVVDFIKWYNENK